MNKEKFLETLRKKLSILEESEILDILNEYEGYIEEKMSDGCTEVEAVKSMGNIEELASDLLSAYKIKTNKKENQKEDFFNNFVDIFVKMFEYTCNIFAHKSFRDIMKFMIELLFIILLTGLCKIPFVFIADVGNNILTVIDSHYAIYHLFYNLWNFILEMAYFLFAVLFFVKLFQSCFLKEDCNIIVNEKRKSSVKIKKEPRSNEPDSSFFENFFNVLIRIGIFFVKGILFLILIGGAFFLVGMSCIVGVSTYLLFKGVTYFGLYLIFISLLLLGIFIFIFVFNFIFNRKNRINVLLIVSLSCFLILGIGCGICTIEFASTQVIYEQKNAEEEFYYDFLPNFVVSTAIPAKNILVDDNLDNQIKVVYSYNDKYSIVEIKPTIEETGKYHILRLRYATYNLDYKKFFEDMITNLKKKTIVANSMDDVEIKVYANSKVKEKLLEYRNEYAKSVNCVK